MAHSVSNGFHLMEDDHPVPLNTASSPSSSTDAAPPSPSSSLYNRRTAIITLSVVLCIVFIPLVASLLIFLLRSSTSSLITSPLALLNCSAPPPHAHLVAVAYLPHGSMTLDPSRPGLPDGASTLHSRGLSISHRIATLQPDLLILTTPHGLALTNSSQLYLGTAAQGSSGWAGFWGEWTVDVRMGGGNTSALMQWLQEEERRGGGPAGNRSRVDGLTAWGGGQPTPLHWGETVPLYFALHDWVAEYSPEGERPLKAIDTSVIPRPPAVIVLSQPIRSSLQAAPTIELGRSIRRWLTQLPPMRVVLILSGDLSHRHPYDPTLLPDYLPDPTGFPPQGSPVAAQFDSLVGRWMNGEGQAGSTWTLSEQQVKQEMAQLVAQNAATCGWGGMLLQQGMMEGQSIRNDSQGVGGAKVDAVWELSDYYSVAPSYFGMATALYTATACLGG